MSDEVLTGAGAGVMVGKKFLSVDQSTDISELSAAEKKALRDVGALINAEEPSRERESLLTQTTTILTPSSTVLQIAAYIESGDDGRPLNGPQTVELAGGDADQAVKVLAAEDLAHGGDGRSTVKDPLQKIVDAAGS